MRVLVLSIQYSPEPTGFAPHVTRFAEYLVEHGDEVTVITGFPFYPEWRRHSSYKGRFWQRRTIAGVEVLRVSHFVPHNPRSLLQRLLMESTFSAMTVAGLLRVRRNFDLVLYVGAHPSVAMAAAAIARLWRVPYALWINDLASAAARDVGIVKEGPLQRILCAFEFQAYARASGAIVLSESFRNALIAHGFDGDHVAVIRSPTDLRNVRPLKSTAFRSKIGLSADDFVVMWAGTMGLKQGLENVICAASIVEARPHPSKPVRWVFVGDGDARETITRLVAAKNLSHAVTIVPFQPYEDMAEMFASADVLLLNQLREVKDSVVPSKLLTYMAAGKPVLAAINRGSEAAGILRHADGGQLVDPEEPEQLAAAVMRLTADSSPLPEMGCRNRRYAEQWFEELTNFSQQAQLLKDIHIRRQRRESQNVA